MNTKCKTILLAVAIVAIIGSVMVVGETLTSTANAASENNSNLSGVPLNLPVRIENLDVTALGMGRHMQRGFLTPPWEQGSSGNVTIDSVEAESVVEASISSFKVGTVTSLGTSWVLPIENEKGVVMSIQVSKVTASTAEQAKSLVEESLGKGWTAGEPQLMRTIYSIPLLDSSNTDIGFVRVDGVTGEIITTPSTTFTVTSEQAKIIVNNMLKEIKVGEVRDMGNLWMVKINYSNKVIMIIPLGKLNTQTSEDALKTVQDSLGKGWNAGEPTQFRLTYNVPIIDSNGNTVSNIMVDGTNGNIISGGPMLCMMPKVTVSLNTR